MRRTSLAALLAAPALLVFSGSVQANPPKQCYYGNGCGGMCLLAFPRIHQIGPLFNYGPYYGYPPFEPYGPWNSYLQYTGPYGYGHGGGGHGHFGHGDKSGHGALCGEGFGHASWLRGGWFHGHGNIDCGGGHGWFHKHHGGGCATGGCQASAFDPAKTDAVTRYAGAGNPTNSAAYYSGLPTLTPAGGFAK